MVEEVLASPFTRLPLWQDDPDNIVGVLHVKALLRAVQAANGRQLDKLDVRAIATPPWFIPDPTDLLSQRQEIRSRHQHFSLDVDAYAEMLDIVTPPQHLSACPGDSSDG